MTHGGNLYQQYIARLTELLETAAVTTRDGAMLPIDTAIRRTHDTMREAHAQGHHCFFIGNGGSAAIASHTANDFSKNAGIRSLVLSDPAVLTCHANDFGYEHVFSKGLEIHARPGDVLVAISSSGQSANMINAASVAAEQRLEVITFTGFDPENPLRRLGDVNFYVASDMYGFVEVAHQVILHAVLDIAMGWTP